MAEGDPQFPTQRQDDNATGIPESFFPIIWEEFTTLNTKPLRPAIGRGEMYWCDGFFPLGPSNLRTLPGTGDILYTAPTTIVWFQSFNLADTSYFVVLLNDGSVYAVNATTGMASNILPSGTITSPSSRMGYSQWGSQYLILTKDQENGYWLWDGTNTFTAGTFGPVVDIDNGGMFYTSSPSYTIQDQNGFIADDNNFSFEIENGSISQAFVTNPTPGFSVDSFVAITIQGGGTDDQAVANPINQAPQQTQGGISEIIVVDGGNGYTGRAYVVFTGGGGSGATASLSIVNGTITAVAILTPGIGYTIPPVVTVTDPGIPGSPSIPGGTGFSGQCTIAFGQITGISVFYGGSGYTTPPTVKILGDGTNASAFAEIAGGAVVNVIMTNYGSGYSAAVAVFENGNNAANISCQLMPFGVSGTTVETYQGRVWVSNGAASSNSPPINRTLFSAPQSPVDFGDGGGGFQSFDSFLRVGYHCLKQSNGFLYLIGDSSVNYISNVQTTSSSSANTVATPITTFSNQNTDPQNGSPWPSSVQVFNRNVVFANTIGIFSSVGGAAEKISTPLDGFYATGPIFGNTDDFSSAVATIFGTSVYMLLLPVTDQYTGQQVNKLLMYDGRRLWTSQQDRSLTYICTQEINSVLTAWGTDGSNIFPLFQTPTIGFTKVAQSKLFSDPGYFLTKTSRSLTGMIYSYTLDSDVTVFIDNETAQGIGNAEISVLPSPSGAWFDDLGVSGTWTNNSDIVGTWGVAGLDVFGPMPIGQSGRLVGLTVQTTASNIALLSIMLSEQQFATNL